MEAMRESWTDRRLDEFAADTAGRFDEIDNRFDRVDGRLDDVDTRLNDVDKRLNRVDGRFDQIDGRLDTLERCMKEGFDRVDADIRELRSQMAAFHRMALQLGGGMMITFAVGFIGVILGSH